MLIPQANLHRQLPFFLNPHLRTFFIAFRERVRERGKEGEKHQQEREASIGCLPRMLGPGLDLPEPGMVCTQT